MYILHLALKIQRLVFRDMVCSGDRRCRLVRPATTIRQIMTEADWAQPPLTQVTSDVQRLRLVGHLHKIYSLGRPRVAI